MTWRGDAFELPTWEPRTDVTGSSPLLGTPTARDWKGEGFEGQLPSDLKLLATPTAWLGRRPSQMEGDADRWHDPARSNELSDQMAAIHLLPTPHGMAKEGQARRPGPTGNELDEDPAQFEARRARINGNGAGTPLAIAVKLLPTPEGAGHATERESRTTAERRGGTLWSEDGTRRYVDLRDAVFETSRSSGASTSPPSGSGKRSTAPRPRLSPEFVEWMMGTPSCGECGRGWTDSACPHSVTAFTSTSAGSSGTRS
jgi:hypothetical protein